MGDQTGNGISLVTGATGLLGSHIAEQLRQRGRRVRALVRPSSDRSFLASIGCESVYGDVTDPASLVEACRGAEVVYHAAARVGDWGPWREFVAITIEGTRHLLDAAATAGVKRFVHISSISVYGYVDGEGAVFDETTPLGFGLYKWAYYSRAKVQAEGIVWDYYRAGKIPVTVIRPSWLYGPRDRATMGRLIDSIRRGKCKLIGDGDNRLNVVHAANVAEAAILAADSDQAVGEAYNCSNDGVLSQRAYFNKIAEALGESLITKSVPYRVARAVAFILECFGHAFQTKRPPLVTRYAVWLIGRRSFFETRKARVQLGWESTISYDEGIPAAVKWYLGAQEHSASRGANA
ncbi:MAG: NAD-dependent epimerase/dehydratase family protein [Planctomycetota bacterium]